MKKRRVACNPTELPGPVITAPPPATAPVVPPDAIPGPKLADYYNNNAADNGGVADDFVIEVPSIQPRTGFTWARTYAPFDPIAMKFLSEFNRLPLQSEFPAYRQRVLVLESFQRVYELAMTRARAKPVKDYSEVAATCSDWTKLKNKNQRREFLATGFKELAELYICGAISRANCSEAIRELAAMVVFSDTVKVPVEKKNNINKFLRLFGLLAKKEPVPEQSADEFVVKLDSYPMTGTLCMSSGTAKPTIYAENSGADISIY